MFICLQRKKIIHILIKKRPRREQVFVSILGRKIKQTFLFAPNNIWFLSLEALENTDKYSKVISFRIGDSFLSFSVVLMSFIHKFFLLSDSFNINSQTYFVYTVIRTQKMLLRTLLLIYSHRGKFHMVSINHAVETPEFDLFRS